MPITELKTYEGVPIGDDNFDGYLLYLRDLVSRSNPFIETATSDENQIVVLGDNIEAKEDLSFQSDSIKNGQSFVYSVPSSSSSTDTSGNITGAGSFTINRPTGNVIFRLKFNFDELDTSVAFSIRLNSTTVYGPFTATADDSTHTHYFSIDGITSQTVSLVVSSASTSGGIPFSVVAYPYSSWQQDVGYYVSYRVENPTFSIGTSAQLKVYFGDPNIVEATDDLSELTLVDTVSISSGLNFNEALVFKPESVDSQNSLIFHIPESANYEVSLDISADSYVLASDSLVFLSGNSYNSYAFITNDDSELYAINSNFLSSDHSTPGVDRWQLPLASLTEFSSSPGSYSYVYEKDVLPVSFNRFYSTDYQSAKFDRNLGGYTKGLSLVTINGIPQVEDDQETFSSFYNESTLASSDIFEFTSLRLGSEYPLPIYTDTVNHQYAVEVIEGFSGIDAANSTDSSLAGVDFLNSLSFPYTDFLLNPVLLLVHYDVSEDTTSYYYIPKDVSFSGTITENHYRVTDPSSGTVEFNFNLGLDSSGDKFWIVSAEQLSQTTTNTVTEYFSSYGKLYYPTANSNLTTKILSFDSSILIDTDLETTLPQLSLIPQTKIIGSGGGAIIADSEGEFSGLTIYALSYPGRVDYNEFVRIQANRYEPDTVNLFYYCGTTAKDFYSGTKPYPVYVKLENNDVSWYNRGINDLTYDPVSRSVNTQLCVTAEDIVAPGDSAKLSALKRKTTLSSSLAGVVSEVDTTFMETVGTGFLVGSTSNTVKTLSGSSGSLLVGTGGEPQTLSIGATGQILTVSGGTPTWSTPSEVNLTGYARLIGDTFTGQVGVPGSGGLLVGGEGQLDSEILFHDDNSNVNRSFLWDDSANDWRIEGNDGVLYKLWHGGNDGAGSEMDADLLDGQQGSYYWNPSNDGDGSGLDADLLDGQQGTYYLNTSATAQTKAGNLFVEGLFSVGKNGGGSSTIAFYDDNANTSRALYWDISSNDWKVQDSTGGIRSLWHGGNDGSGSGLDADLLDGFQASYFLSSQTTRTPGSGRYDSRFIKFGNIYIAKVGQDVDADGTFINGPTLDSGTYNLFGTFVFPKVQTASAVNVTIQDEPSIINNGTSSVYPRVKVNVGGNITVWAYWILIKS